MARGKLMKEAGCGCAVWGSGFIVMRGWVVVAAVAAGATLRNGGAAGDGVFAEGDVPGFARLAEVGAEERGVGPALFDEIGAFPGGGFAGIAGFFRRRWWSRGSISVFRVKRLRQFRDDWSERRIASCSGCRRIRKGTRGNSGRLWS